VASAQHDLKNRTDCGFILEAEKIWMDVSFFIFVFLAVLLLNCVFRLYISRNPEMTSMLLHTFRLYQQES